MDQYHGIEQIPRLPGTALTIGTFDGLHLGHRAILRELCRVAESSGSRSLLITFDPHPQQVLQKTGEGVPLLTTLDRKRELLEEIGVDALGVIPFSLEFAATPWQEFVDRLIDQVGIGHMVIGHDHAFGKGREGNAERLRAYGGERGYTFTQVGPLSFGGQPVSSTRIRRALLAGEVAEAATLLDRPYRLPGTIVRGAERGRTLGFPTANLKPIDPLLLVPGSGVYATRMAIVDRESGGTEMVGGMTNIGVRPTFTEGEERTIETHLFDFSDELYDREVSLEFVKLLRYERKFSSKETFMEQLQNDRDDARRALGIVDES